MNWKYYCLAAVLQCTGPGAAWAEQWFRVGEPGSEATSAATVEIDLETLHARRPGADAVIRVTFKAQRFHAAGFAYRSFVATTRFDCQRPTLEFTSAAYFSEPDGLGLRVGADSMARASGMPSWLPETVPEAARRALMRASCAATAPTY